MKASLIGRNGFIGKTLMKKLQDEGWEVFNSLVPGVDYAFLFSAPSSHEQFKLNPDKCFEETIYSFINAVQFCRDNKIKLVFPSSITAKTKESPYARCKAALEEIQAGYGTDTLALRITCGYGPNETHKGYYASVLYKFCQDMKKGISPVIWGDGSQTRDFIYQDDIADHIYNFALNSKNQIEEIGGGRNVSFVELIDIINKVQGTNIKPTFINRPANYVMDSFCDKPVECKVSLEEGIKKTLESLE